ncbi:PREDICTED: kinesin-like protein KIF16B [Priapulus caudatus]|uniref:Kinesin-like protein KIF16B n=1 Tax=Priapulus caudatus TaxID=37621 RepID=A0ABM1EHS1_PRICU|nr:PREDICTED: kinesin-like protein KIF16B [Priapulus caudatus]
MLVSLTLPISLLSPHRLTLLCFSRRINALVEAEVKRRCFDETVRRAKALKRSRERERRTREQEMSRLKRAHEIEIQRLKQQLVSRTAGTALPTKANPYATIHNSDSLTSLRRPSADVVAGGNDLPLRVAVPAFVLRGHGADAHYEYEVQVALRGESWVVYRRYSRFRELRQRMVAAYSVTAGIPFPPKRWFRNRSEWVVAQRREQLEGYLRRLVEVCGAAPGCPLNVADGRVVKHSLWEFSSFFKKGVFETTKHGTG